MASHGCDIVADCIGIIRNFLSKAKKLVIVSLTDSFTDILFLISLSTCFYKAPLLILTPIMQCESMIDVYAFFSNFPSLLLAITMSLTACLIVPSCSFM